MGIGIGLLCSIVVLCGNGILYNIVILCRNMWCYVEMGGGPSSNPSTPSNSYSLTHPHPYPFFSSIIYIIIKDQQIYSTSLIFWPQLTLFAGPTGIIFAGTGSTDRIGGLPQIKNFGQMLFGLLFNFSSNNEGYTKLNIGVFGVLFFFTIYIEKKKSAPILHVSQLLIY